MARPNRDNEILAAALAVFVERGYDGARVRQIAERAGVSDAALYSHHKSKEDVALALFRRHIGRYAQGLDEVAGDAQVSVQDRVRRVAWRTVQAFIEEPDAVGFVITHQARFIGALPDDFRYPIRVVEELVRQGQADGSVRPGPVRVLAALVFGCIVQPIRTVLEAPPGTIDLRQQAAQALIADAAWSSIAQR
jgi:AcrR family transcriptional regulator